MSAQVTFHHGIGLPPVKDMVQSLSASASTALANLESLSANPKPRQAAQISAVLDAAPTADWLRPLSAAPAPRFGKSGALALVVLAHAVAFYALSHLPPQTTRVIAQPIQVVTLAELQNKDRPAPPLQLPHMPSVELPIEPVVIEIAAPETTSIAVTMRESEPAAATAPTIGTPKIVSSVEYIREPSAKYPPAARALKQRGTVTLRALIDVNGTAREVNVHRSSGFRLLDDAARTAVLNALFKPYIENGQSSPVYVFIPIEFGAAAT